jgi:hypothetical protein
MAFTVSTTHFMDFVQVVVSGPASIKTFVDLVKTVEQESLAWSHKRVLVDMRGMVGRLDDTEQMFLGELVAQHLPHLDRMATIVYRDQVTSGSENAARDHGLQVRVFVAKEEAMAWLLSTPPGASKAPRTQPSHA